MRLFLDSSVLLAATGSTTGASRYLIEHAATHGWFLLTSPYCVVETGRNLPKLPRATRASWPTFVQPRIKLAADRVSLDRPLVFPKTKDRPVVVAALAASCDWLLTLDETDFHGKLGSRVYSLGIATPGEFLIAQRLQGKI